MKAPALQSKK